MNDHDLGIIFDCDDLQFDAAAIPGQPVGPVAHREDRLVIVHHPQSVSLANLLPPGGLSEPEACWSSTEYAAPHPFMQCFNSRFVRCSDYVEQHWIRQSLNDRSIH